MRQMVGGGCGDARTVPLNGRTVTSPSGEVWTVRRRWTADRRVRWSGGTPFRRSRQTHPSAERSRHERGSRGDWLDGLQLFDTSHDNPLVAIAVIAVLVLVVGLAWFLVVPLLLAILDLTILVLLTLIGIAARVVLRHPWEIEALGPQGRRLSWQVPGWRRSRRAITAVADLLAQGQTPPTNSSTFPP